MEVLIIMIIVYSIFQKFAEKARKSREAKEISTPKHVPIEGKINPTGEVSKQELEPNPFKAIEEMFFPERNKQEQGQTWQQEEYNTLAYDYELAEDNNVNDNYKTSNYSQPTTNYHSTSYDQVSRQYLAAQEQKSLSSYEIGTVSIDDLGKKGNKEIDIKHAKYIQQKFGLDFNQETIRQGVIWSEVLGAPKSRLSWRSMKRSKNVV